MTTVHAAELPGGIATPSDTPPAYELVTMEIPVTWHSAPAFDGRAAGLYVFTAELASGFVLADGVTAPIFMVTVEPQAATQTEIIAPPIKPCRPQAA